MMENTQAGTDHFIASIKALSKQEVLQISKELLKQISIADYDKWSSKEKEKEEAEEEVTHTLNKSNDKLRKYKEEQEKEEEEEDISYLEQLEDMTQMNTKEEEEKEKEKEEEEDIPYLEQLEDMIQMNTKEEEGEEEEEKKEELSNEWIEYLKHVKPYIPPKHTSTISYGEPHNGMIDYTIHTVYYIEGKAPHFNQYKSDIQSKIDHFVDQIPKQEVPWIAKEEEKEEKEEKDIPQLETYFEPYLGTFKDIDQELTDHLIDKIKAIPGQEAIHIARERIKLLSIIDYKKLKSKEKEEENIFTTCKTAACAGSLEKLRYAHENGYPWDEDTCAYAALSGSLICLQYAHEHGCPWNENTCHKAARVGSLLCLQYAHEHGCPWNNFTCFKAVQAHSLPCLQYAYEHGCPWWSHWICQDAIKCGSVECLQYARARE